MNIGSLDGPVLVFGGRYGNLQATTAILTVARSRNIPGKNIICTGDVVAYCGDAKATVDVIRDAAIHVVMGNCEESLGNDSSDCGCGFEEGSACDLLSAQWFAHASQALDDDAKRWMFNLPRQLTFEMNGRKMGEEKLPEAYAIYLESDLWPNMDVLPEFEQSGRRRDYSRRPPTPPYVRFRIRRFMMCG